MLWKLSLLTLVIFFTIHETIGEGEPTPTPEACSFDVVFVVDESSSITRSSFDIAKKFIIDFPDCFTQLPDIWVGVIPYHCVPRTYLPLSPPSGPFVFNKLMQKGGESRTGLAIRYMKDTSDFRAGALRAAVVMTDGWDLRDIQVQAQADAARAAGIELYAVSIGNLVDNAALAVIGGSTDNVFSSDIPCELAYRILTDICNYAGPVDGGWTNWSPWSSCSVTCGAGTQTRDRTCTNPAPADGGAECDGQAQETQDCDTGVSCPVDGMWSTWMAWSTCSKSCGSGTQVRQRECNNPAPVGGGNPCVGSQQQSRQCSTWACPDCAATCAIGTRDPATCECGCQTDVLTATVRNMKNAPLEGASIHYADRPDITLGTTDATGSASVNGVCASQVDLLIRKDGYSPTVATTVPATPTTSTVTANIEILIAPIITQHPESRSRLVGQEVTFCCEAHGSPEPDADDYEWFRNGDVLDKSVYGYSNQLTVTNLALSDAGEYRCRANSIAGSTYSESALLQIYGSATDSYNAAPSPEYIKLPADCVQPDGTKLYNVGKCDYRPCVGSSYSIRQCNDATKYCSAVGSLQAQTIDCGRYTISIMAISSCECLECGDPVTYVRGELLGGPTNKPVVNADILVNGVPSGFTTFSGTFTLEIPPNAKRLAVTFTDIYKEFVETTKILDFVEGESTYHRVHIRERAQPIVMSSEKTSTVDLGTVPGMAPIAQLEIPANSFYTTDGQPYTGTVQAYVSFLDPRDLTNVQDMPSDLTCIDEEGQEQQLATFGMFSLDFEDVSGNELEVAGTVDIFLNENEVNFTVARPGEEVKVWSLNPETGRWEAESVITQTPVGRRRKRQTLPNTFTWNGNFRITRNTFNIDVVRGGQRCYSKVRAYRGRNVINDPTSQVSSVNVLFVEVFSDGTQRLVDFFGAPTSVTYGACVKGWCSGFATTFYVSASQGATQYDAVTYAELGFNPPGGYIRAPDGKAFSTALTVGSSGPSYSSSFTCNNAPISDNHFKFYGPQVSGVIEINTISYNPTDNMLRPNYLSWYPTENPAQKESCFMKIMVTGANENLRARVVSKVGTHAANLGTDYGRREDDLVPAGAAVKGACVEYKCTSDVWTTRNNRPFRDPAADDHDYTFVELSFLRNDGSTANCNRIVVNTSFQSLNKVMTLPFLASQYSINPPANTDLSRFRFYDPEDDLGQTFGIYKATGALDTSKQNAYEQCLAGTTSGAGSTTIDPDLNWFIHFNCT